MWMPLWLYLRETANVLNCFHINSMSANQTKFQAMFLGIIGQYWCQYNGVYLDSSQMLNYDSDSRL